MTKDYPELLGQASFLDAFPANSVSKNADFLSFLLEFLSFFLSLCSGPIGSTHDPPKEDYMVDCSDNE